MIHIPDSIVNFIFDIDGTLINTEETSMNSLHDTILALLGRDMSRSEIYPFFSIPSYDVAPALGYADNEGFLNEWNRRWELVRHYSRPFPHAAEILQAARKRGGSVGLVSSRTRYEYETEPVLEEWAPMIDHVILAEDIPHPKPHPDPMLEFFRRAGVNDPSSCIYLGDAPADSGCAKAAGCYFALADWDGRGTRGIESDFVFTDPADFLSAIS